MRKIILFILVGSLILGLGAFSYADGVGTTGASCLKLGVGARASAMGDAFSAIADDATSIYWNPAGLTQIEGTQLGATHTQWLEEINYEHLAYVSSHRDSAFGLSINWLNTGKIEETTLSYPGGTGNSFEAKSSVVTLAYARKMGESLSLGAGLKYIGEKFEKESATSYGLDLGGFYKKQKFSFALGVQNIGNKEKFTEEEDPLPLNYRLGMAYLLNERIKLALDVNKPLDNEVNFHTGIECHLTDTLALRAGYKSGPEDIGSGITGGLGFKFKNISIDYAYVPYEDLGDTHRISLSVKF
ncbi:PorV/PorQ family protein [Candidatus Aerophobetes bacterium]|nr:PorV/PorQ family protein [Candidatus Aerophobetes bacterium]